jgi:type VI secretion system protein ImpA
LSSDDDTLLQQARAWLEPLSGDDGPCGPDLEYDNAFLELSKAAEGKPESQFDRGSPPDWRSVRTQAEELFERTRDLRIALLWTRAVVNLEGVRAFEAGMTLVLGLLEQHWDTVIPVPDPSDNDPYARANALAMLPQMEGGLGDLLNSSFVNIKGLGDIRLRDVEVALSHMSAREGETPYSREQLERILASADQEGAGLRDRVSRLQQLVKQLGTLMNERFGSGSSAELKPLADLLANTLSMIPEPTAVDDDEGGTDEGGADSGGGGGARPAKAGLSGSVNSRAEAVRAIEMVCAYLERSEPTNPAQLFLKRASALLERNFLELLKELAPGALDEVARMVGVDPSTIGESEQ